MFGFLRKKRKYKKTDFTKRKLVNGEYHYYNRELDTWLLWSVISTDTEFKNEYQLVNSTLLGVEISDSFSDPSITQSIGRTKHSDGFDDYSPTASSSRNHDNSSNFNSSSSSSYDGGCSSSSSSFDSGSCGGGGF